MQQPPGAIPQIPSASASRGATLIVLAWGAISIIPLLISAARIPLWARVHPPLEQFALPTMLITQIAIVSLIFPLLFQSGTSTAAIMLGSGLLLQLAGILGDEAASQTCQAIAWIWIWQSAIWVFAKALKTPRAQQIGVAITTTAGIGGMLLFYLREEFAMANEVGQTKLAWCLLIAALISAVFYYLLRSRQALHR